MLESQLTPGLLLAMPQLLDPNFTRTVVLMVEHNDQGSFGLVINRPLEVTMAELLDSMDIQWNGASDAVVWSGGPVMPGTGWLLYEPPQDQDEDEDKDEDEDEDDAPEPTATLEVDGQTLLCPGVALATCGPEGESLREMAEAPPEGFRLLLGYAGWGPGQLAFEMAHGSWLHVDVNPRLVFGTPPDEMWEAALRTLGVDPEALIQGFGIH